MTTNTKCNQSVPDSTVDHPAGATSIKYRIKRNPLYDGPLRPLAEQVPEGSSDPDATCNDYVPEDSTDPYGSPFSASSSRGVVVHRLEAVVHRLEV